MGSASAIRCKKKNCLNSIAHATLVIKTQNSSRVQTHSRSIFHPSRNFIWKKADISLHSNLWTHVPQLLPSIPCTTESVLSIIHKKQLSTPLLLTSSQAIPCTSTARRYVLLTFSMCCWHLLIKFEHLTPFFVGISFRRVGSRDLPRLRESLKAQSDHRGTYMLPPLRSLHRQRDSKLSSLWERSWILTNWTNLHRVIWHLFSFMNNTCVFIL